ncbi:MAG: AtpZ/AtpI family protein [Nitrosospira sp.]
MNEETGRKPEERPSAGETEFSRRVGARATRKLKAQRTRRTDMETIWSGLGMVGLVGWSVVVPTLLGAALGIWLDRNYPMNHSWTLTMLLIGMITGCLNAWHWITREDRVINEEWEEPDNSNSGSEVREEKRRSFDE